VKMDEAAKRRVRAGRLLLIGKTPDLWTLKRVRLLIEKHFGIAYSDVHVWRILGSLGFSSQKPEKRAIERSRRSSSHC